MNDRYKKLTIKLTERLANATNQFLIENFKNNEENTSDIINLILSGHMSSLINQMKFISSEHKEINKTTESFLKKLLIFVQSNVPGEENWKYIKNEKQ